MVSEEPRSEGNDVAAPSGPPDRERSETAQNTDGCLLALSIPGLVALGGALLLLSISDLHTYQGILKVPGMQSIVSLAGAVGFAATPLAVLILLVRKTTSHPVVLLLLLAAVLGEVACVVAANSGRLGLIWSPVG
jgi:hypothetical protein